MESLTQGQELPVYEAPVSNRHDLIHMSLLTDDPNIIHLDRVAAEERGFEDVIQQGPMNVGRAFEAVESWLGDPWDLKHCHLRLIGQVYPGETLLVQGTVENIDKENGVTHADISVREVKKEEEDLIIQGSIRAAFPNTER